MTVLLGGARDFSSLRIVFNDGRSHSDSYPVGKEGEKHSSCQADNSPSSSTEVKKRRSYISAPLHAFGACKKKSLFTITVVIFDVIPSCFWPSSATYFFSRLRPYTCIGFVSIFCAVYSRPFFLLDGKSGLQICSYIYIYILQFSTYKGRPE
jgi:hypothetical protein